MLVTRSLQEEEAATPSGVLRLICNTIPGGQHKRRFGDENEDYEVSVCGAAHADPQWRRQLNLKTLRLHEMLVEVPEEQNVATRLPWGMEYGSLRYFLGDERTGRPRQYCFEHSGYASLRDCEFCCF